MFKRITAIILLIGIAVLFCGCGEQPINSSGFMFDTAAVITVYSKYDSAAADNTLRYCAEFENILSATLEQSEVYKLNNSKTTIDVSEHILKNIQKAEYYSNLSGGAFDITIRPVSSLWDFKNAVIPSDEQIKQALKQVGYKNIKINGTSVDLNGTKIDLGGIAKGYIADMAVEHLKEQGVKKAIVNLGGNIITFGKEYDIGVRSLSDASVIAAVIRVENKAVSTSGTYERSFTKQGVLYHHILDSATGYPAQVDIASATVICNNSIDADALSTVCVLLGLTKATELINGMDGVEAVFIDNNGKLHTTNGVKLIEDNIYSVE